MKDFADMNEVYEQVWFLLERESWFRLLGRRSLRGVVLQSRRCRRMSMSRLSVLRLLNRHPANIVWTPAVVLVVKSRVRYTMRSWTFLSSFLSSYDSETRWHSTSLKRNTAGSSHWYYTRVHWDIGTQSTFHRPHRDRSRPDKRHCWCNKIRSQVYKEARRCKAAVERKSRLQKWQEREWCASWAWWLWIGSRRWRGQVRLDLKWPDVSL
jgi:hypothetical protein